MCRIAILLILLFSFQVHAADTLLIGSDGTNYGTACWIDDSTTISNYSWKSSRYTAKASGTISYFRIRSPITPTGCTNDSGCWAIYEGGTNSTLGVLKAYNCFSGYNWTTLGQGWHTFNVTTTVTDLNITQGAYYWLVYYSYGCDATYYANAGCSAFIPAYRGSAAQACIDLVELDSSSGYASQSTSQSTVITPPAPASFNIPTQTYMMWGIWSITSIPSSVQGLTITGGTLK